MSEKDQDSTFLSDTGSGGSLEKDKKEEKQTAKSAEATEGLVVLIFYLKNNPPQVTKHSMAFFVGAC